MSGEKRRGPWGQFHTSWRTNVPPRPGPRPRYRRVTPFVGTTYVLEWNESPRPEKWEDLEPWPERPADEPGA